MSSLFRIRSVVCACMRHQHKMAVLDQKYEEAVKTLNQLQCNKMLSVEQKYEGIGLTVMRQFLERVEVSVGDIDNMKCVHISGTKGKGSTCAFVESILRHNGIKTGFFSSPHLLEIRERIRINGKPISTQLFTKYFWEVYDILENTKDFYEVKTPSYFYFLTVMAFYVFKHEKIDAAVMEVGIGGAYDCTNVIVHPTVCGVSSLGIDHVALLGNTLESIAWQKSGIFKKNVPAFTVCQPEEGSMVLEERAEELGTTLNVVPQFDEYPIEGDTDLKLGLSGEHQKLNASLAVQLAACWLNTQAYNKAHTCLPFPLNSSFQEGLAKCQWPGRAQIVKFKSMTFYLDGAHTMRSLTCAAKWFNDESAKEQKELKLDCDKILAFNITNERDAYALLSSVFPCNFNGSIFTPNIATLIQSQFNDQTNLKCPVEDRLIRVLSNRNDWVELCASHNHTDVMKTTSVFPSIADAVCWLAKDRDLKLYERSQAMTADYLQPSCSFNGKHLQVLVTGSLHLVGGYLRILKPGIND